MIPKAEGYDALHETVHSTAPKPDEELNFWLRHYNLRTVPLTPISERIKNHIIIKNYMGELWSSAYNVLSYLLKNKGLRHYLRTKAQRKKVLWGCPGWLTHPLLYSYISLKFVESDRDFVKVVKKHLHDKPRSVLKL
jgi:hypothetical protein